MLPSLPSENTHLYIIGAVLILIYLSRRKPKGIPRSSKEL